MLTMEIFMAHPETYWSIMIAILGVAYPILYQVIARFEDKYCSSSIAELFKNERRHKFFQRSLYFSVSATILWTLDLPPWSIHRYFSLLENSSTFLMMVAVILLIIAFLSELHLVVIYSVTLDIAKRIGKKFSRNEKQSSLYLCAAAELMISAIKSGDRDAIETLTDLIGSKFRYSYLQKHELLEDYFELNSRLLIAVISSRTMHRSKIAYNIISASDLIGDQYNSSISFDTLSHIWYNIEAILESNEPDLFMIFWEAMDFKMGSFIFTKEYADHHENTHDTPDNSNNEPNVHSTDKHIDVQEQIYQLMYSIGGMLVFHKKYDVLARALFYTTSEPPHYHLLPVTFTDVYKQFVYFYDVWGNNFWDSNGYSLPHIDGINARSATRSWICSYIALLFIRLYSLRLFGNYIEIFQIEIPRTQRERRIWLESIERFRTLVEDWIARPDTLSELGLSAVTKVMVDSPDNYPLRLIDQLKSSLKQKMLTTVITQSLSESKVRVFYSSSKEILDNYFESIKEITASSPKGVNSERTYLWGDNLLLEKNCFQDDVDIPIDNYDTILANMVKSKLQRHFSHTLYRMVSHKYLYKPDEIFTVIDKLKLDKEKHIILAMNIYFEHYINTLGVHDLTKDSYKGVAIRRLDAYDREEGESFLIVEKNNLPYLNLLEISSDMKEKYQLDEVLYKDKVLGSVIDLRNNEVLLQEIQPQNADKDLSRYVLACIGISLMLQYDNNIKMVQIQQYTRRNSQRLLSNVAEIKPF